MAVQPGNITPAELRGRLHDGGEIAIVDTREEGNFHNRHLLMASCLPLSRLELIAPALLPRRAVPIVVCDAGVPGGGGLAERAAARLSEGGWSDVSVLVGGVAAWEAAGFPIYSGVHVPSKAFAEVVEHEYGTPWISAEELAQRQKQGERLAIFDSRSYEEYHSNSIPGAISVPGAELVYRFHQLVPSPDTFVVVNCGGRTRSIIGAQALIDAGVPNRVVSLKDGTMAWHLAGLDVVNGATDRAPEVSAEGVAAARQRAEAVARRYGVPTIDRATLALWQREADQRTLYVLDVRDPAEYSAGHLPGSLMAPGGQLVQETDSWLGIWGARVVLVDDTGVRARMTASWLKRMGWDVAVLDRGLEGVALESGVSATRSDVFPLAGPESDDHHPRRTPRAPRDRYRPGIEPPPSRRPYPRRMVRDPRAPPLRAGQIAGSGRAGADQRRRRDRPLCRRRDRIRCRAPGAGAGGRDGGLESGRIAARNRHGTARRRARRRVAVGARPAGRPRALYARISRLGDRPGQPDRPRHRLPVPPRRSVSGALRQPDWAT